MVSSRFTASTWRCLLFAVVVATSRVATAQSQDPVLSQRFWIESGAFRPAIDTTLRVDSSDGAIGTQLNLEQDLGLRDSSTEPWLLLGARLGDRWRLEFEYFNMKRDASTTLARSIRFGDANYPVLAPVATQFDSSIYRFSVGFSFLRTPQAEVGATLGAHVTHFKIGVTGQASVTGQLSQIVEEVEDQTVPLPTLGLYATYALARSWTLATRADILDIKVNDYDGRLLNVGASLMYSFTRNFGAGLGYRYLDYKLEAIRSDFRGDFNYKFHGPTLFVHAGF